MAAYRKYHGISLADNSVVENLHIERLASDPTLLEAGRIWYNTTTKQLKTSVRDINNNLVVKTYVDTDSFAHWQQGIIMKEAVKVATTTAVTDPFVSGIPGTIDGITLTTNDRVLIKDATNPIDNGIVFVSSPIGQASVGNEIKLMPFGSNYDPVVITRSVSSTNPNDMTLVFAEGTGTETCTTVGNVTTLTLKKSTNKRSCLLNDQDGGIIKISEKTPFRVNQTYGQPIAYTTGTGNNIPFSVTVNTNGYNPDFKINTVINVSIILPTNSSGAVFKTTTEIVNLLNANESFNKLFVAEVNSDVATFGSYQGSGNAVIYDDFKKAAKYDTTASTVMTLLNNSGHWTAKMNDNTTVTPRWQSIISNNNFIVSSGTWDGTKFTSTTGYVGLACRYDYSTSIFKSGICLGNYFNCSPLIFNPNKIKITFSSPSVGTVYIAGLNDDTGQSLYSGAPTSGQEIALTYKDEVFQTINISVNAQSITDIQAYVGDDWRIFDSNLMYSTASTVTPGWRSIMSRDSFYSTDMNLTYDENNNIRTGTGTGTRTLYLIKNANKVNYSNLNDDNYNYRPIKMKINYTGMINNFQINNSNTNIGSSVLTSGDEITISSFIPNENNIIKLTWYNESPSIITDIQVYDGTTGITPNNIGKLGLPFNYSVVRSTDADENTSPSELRAGATVFVTNGATNGQIQYTLVTSGNIIPGTTAQTWTATNTSVTNTLKTKINAQRFRYTSSTPATSHVITHNLGSNYLDVKYMVYDTEVSKWRNDGALLQYDSTNQLTITLTESSNAIVTIQKLDDLT